MTTLEMSNEFDVLYNNITSNLAPGLDEYEKSVFLTKALNMLVKEYFNNRTDAPGGGFDGSQKRQYDFSKLIETRKLVEVTLGDEEKLDKRSKTYLFPENYFLAVNEIIADDKYQYSVLPIDYAEYSRLMLKPYNFPVKRGVWRIFTSKKSTYANVCIRTFSFGTVPASISSYTSPTEYEVSSYKPVEYLPKDDVFGSYVLGDFWNDGTNNARLAVAVSTSTNGFKNLCICVDKTEAPSLNNDLVVINYIKDYLTAKQDSLSGGFLDAYNIFVKNNYSPEVSNQDIQSILRPALDLERGDTSSRIYFPEASASPDGTVVITYSVISKIHNDTGYNDTTTGTSLCSLAEVIGKFVGNLVYKLRYVKIIKPIILDNLTNYGTDLTIDGLSTPTECELPEETHQEIVERAVTLAKIAWLGATATLVAALQLLLRDRDNR